MRLVAVSDGEEPPAGVDHEAVDRARSLIADARQIVVLTGAGISTESGIPDFRGPQGVWTKDPAAERMAHIDTYVGDPEVRRRAWQNRLKSPTWSAEPNAGHRALVVLEQSGRLDTLVTQNVDGLHHAAGSDPAHIVEIHGTMREVVCLRCDDRHPADQTLERVRQGEDDPTCLVTTRDGQPCGGMLKTATISFGQQLVAEDRDRAEDAAASCDLLLAVGTSLGVYPAAALVPQAAATGAEVIIVNGEPTPFDDLAAVVLRAPIGEVLPLLVDGLQPR